MAASLYNNIRLDTDLTGDLPTNTYPVLVDSEYIHEPLIAVQRSLTGRLHVHRIMDGSSPQEVPMYRYNMILTRAQKDQLVADLGKNVYFMPNYRDEADTSTYRSVMVFRGMTGIKPVGPCEDYFRLTIHLEESTGNSV